MTTTRSPYASLWCKSNFAFLEGASTPQELVEKAHGLGLRALAITDRDGVYGVVQAHVRAKQLGMHLLIGSELSIGDGTKLVVIARTLRGYQNLCGLISKGRLRSEKGKSVVAWHEVCEHAEDVIALWGGRHSALSAEAEPVRVAGQLRDAFGDRLYAMLARHQEPEDVTDEQRLRERAERWQIPLVAATETLYHQRDRKPLQDVLTCIRHGVSLSRAGRLLTANAEHALHSADDFHRLYADIPEAIERTVEVADRCDFNLDQIRYRYPSERLPDGKTTHEQLCDLTHAGAVARYGEVIPDNVTAQLHKELSLIHELEYDGYFLTMVEIVRFCHERNILCQGRGSAANSAVCYCLGITAIDPVRMGLLFERFLSRERAEPPDIDLDIEHDRREEVIQHVYDKYGRTHAAMVANVIRYRGKSAVRDVGKALGIAEVNLDRIAKLLSHYDQADNELLKNAGFDPKSRTTQLLLSLSEQLQGFPRHLSIHPGGFVLGHAPIDHLVPQENATMADRTVIQWDKDDVEALGLFKVDLLGLGALRQVHLCFDLLRAHHKIELTMATIPPDDTATFDMICRGDTVGVFQIESRAQMSMLPRLKPRTFYDLVVEVSIVRPGPITGGMVHPYLRRRNGEEEVTYPHPCLKPVLEKTLGIPLFQEQVMRLAVVAADYTPGEADQLRRDMAAWRKSGQIDHHRDRLVNRMIEKGIEREFAERVFEQIRGFGEYGFPESHAASFALISYVTSWLKQHYPAAFMCSLLNAQPMGFYAPATIIDDAKRHGVEVLPIDVSHSAWDCTLDLTAGPSLTPNPSPQTWRGEGVAGDVGVGLPAVRIGFRYVQGVRAEERELLERAKPPFVSLEDFVTRCPLSEKSLVTLVEAGAFDGLGLSRRAALWEALRLTRTPELPLPSARQQVLPMFDALSVAETIRWDYAASHHSVQGHPLTPLRARLNQEGMVSGADIQRLAHGTRIRYAGLVICRQRPATAAGVTFMTLEDETGFVNVVLWQKVFTKYTVVARTASFLGITGRLQVEGRVIHLVAEQLWVPRLREQNVKLPSRDFH